MTWMPTIHSMDDALPTPVMEDRISGILDCWTREEQIIAYKYLHGLGFRIGASLDYEQTTLRRARRAHAQP
jgi:hypothetical protein